MILSQLHEITTIDSEIVELHERLESLYRQRADLTSLKKGTVNASQSAIDDTVSLDGIDLSL